MRRCLLLVVFIIAGLCVKAQHPYFFSSDAHLISLNPSFAGSAQYPRFQAATNNDKPNQGSNYYAGADLLVNKTTGIGVSYFMNKLDPHFDEMNLGFSYAYHFTIGKRYKIVPSFQFSVFRINFDPKGQYITDFSGKTSQWGYEPRAITKYNVDCSSGLLIYEKNFFIGISFLSLNQPDEGIHGVSKRWMSYCGQAGIKLDMGKDANFKLYSTALAQMQLKFVQVGTYLGYKFLNFHMAVRHDQGYILGACVEHKGFRAGYNRIFRLQDDGMHEGYIAYTILPKKNKKDLAQRKKEGLIDKSIRLDF
jgi:hypothetical protein